MSTETRLHSEHRGLRDRMTVIADPLLPALASPLPATEAFGVTIRQPKQFPHAQERLDRRVAEDKRMSLTLFEDYGIAHTLSNSGLLSQDIFTTSSDCVYNDGSYTII